jgi:hypothetical protein
LKEKAIEFSLAFKNKFMSRLREGYTILAIFEVSLEEVDGLQVVNNKVVSELPSFQKNAKKTSKLKTKFHY